MESSIISNWKQREDAGSRGMLLELKKIGVV